MVWKQYRRVEAGNVSIEELDMDITIVYSKSSGLEFDVIIWNLADDTWSRIEEGDPCRITLGWEDGPTKTVLFGTIEKMLKTPDENDVSFRLKGKDETDRTLRFGFSKTYVDKTFSDIARSIAGEIGLTVGEVESTSAGPEREFTVQKDRPARHWLNQLIAKTQDKTDTPWEWFVDAGKFYFVKKDGRKEEAVRLSFENTLITIGESEGEKEAEQSGLDFTALCEPRIRKGAAVAVETPDYTGAYKVTEYRFNSNTISGDHEVTGKLVPLGASYEIAPAGARELLN